MHPWHSREKCLSLRHSLIWQHPTQTQQTSIWKNHWTVSIETATISWRCTRVPFLRWLMTAFLVLWVKVNQGRINTRPIEDLLKSQVLLSNASLQFNTIKLSLLSRTLSNHKDPTKLRTMNKRHRWCLHHNKGPRTLRFLPSRSRLPQAPFLLD